MIKYPIRHIITSILTTMFLFASCKHKETEYHSITDKIEAQDDSFEGTSITSDALIEEMKLIEITEGGHHFLIPERKGQLKSFACTECHSRPLDKMNLTQEEKKAHWDIKLEHASNSTMNCVTCHNAEAMDNLVSLTGQEIDFNASYKLCSQCHAPQFQDWKGGAHGKRIAGWAPPRTAMTCVNCHDPHDPQFETRWPARFNTQMEKERKEELPH